MREVEKVLEQIFLGQERLSHVEIYRRVVAIDVSAELSTALDSLPEGEYAQDELAEALGALTGSPAGGEFGIPAGELTDEELHRELAEVHRTRNDTLRHGSDHALARHNERMAELEDEYLLRFPEREVDPQRLRAGARARRAAPATALDDLERMAQAASADSTVTGPASAAQPPPGPSRAQQLPRTVARTGADQPWDPEDLAIADGRDPTPRNIERARRELDERGAAAIERTVP